MGLVILLSSSSSHPWVDLLREAMGNNSRDSMRLWAVRYQGDPRYRLYGIRRGIRVIGLVGCYREASFRLEITHIAVERRSRRQYLGTQMLGFLTLMYKDTDMTAYTDDDAVGFYRRVGYQVESLRELYPARTRYRCTRWGGRLGYSSGERSYYLVYDKMHNDAQ